MKDVNTSSNFVLIPMTNGEQLKVSPEDAEWMKRYKWSVQSGQIRSTYSSGCIRLASRIIPLQKSRAGTIKFRDGDRRNWTRENVYRDTDSCYLCGQPGGKGMVCPKCLAFSAADRAAGKPDIIRKATDSPKYAHMLTLRMK